MIERLVTIETGLPYPKPRTHQVQAKADSFGQLIRFHQMNSIMVLSAAPEARNLGHIGRHHLAEPMLDPRSSHPEPSALDLAYSKANQDRMKTARAHLHLLNSPIHQYFGIYSPPMKTL